MCCVDRIHVYLFDIAVISEYSRSEERMMAEDVVGEMMERVGAAG